jgi:hypothetical protein
MPAWFAAHLAPLPRITLPRPRCDLCWDLASSRRQPEGSRVITEPADDGSSNSDDSPWVLDLPVDPSDGEDSSLSSDDDSSLDSDDSSFVLDPEPSVD